MLSILINGAKGKMGSTTVAAVQADPDTKLVGAIDVDDDLASAIDQYHPDVVIDFTHPSSVKQNALTILSAGCRAVIGTTGLSQDDLKDLDTQARHHDTSIAVCPNFAIGAVLMMQLSGQIAKHLPDVEIIEYHHNQKADAPSGTAIKTAEMIKESVADINPNRPKGETEIVSGSRGGKIKDIPIHAVRIPGVIANQSVIFGGPGQTLTLSHDTISRDCFMPGVLLVAKNIHRHQGLVYGLEHFLG